MVSSEVTEPQGEVAPVRSWDNERRLSEKDCNVRNIAFIETLYTEVSGKV